MPILFSSSNASAMSENVLWVDDYISRADSGLLTPTSKSFGFKTYIPSSAKALLLLNPTEYLAAFRDELAKTACGEPPQSSTQLQIPAKQQAELVVQKTPGMAGPVNMKTPTISITSSDTTPIPDDSAITTRKSASLHKNLITKLRPLPLQYVWAVYYEKPVTSSTASSITTNTSAAATYTDRLTILAPTVPDIGEFYKIFNNTPWPSIPSRHSVHIFRAGVRPLWEDPENLHGGCFTLKVRRQPQQQQQQHRGNNDYDDAVDNRAKRVWEEICLMGCGGELQAALAEERCRDHVLGMTFSPRLYWVHVSVWLKGVGVGAEEGKGREIVQRHILERLSPELRPAGKGEYYYKRHCECEGWEEVAGLGRNKVE